MELAVNANRQPLIVPTTLPATHSPTVLQEILSVKQYQPLLRKYSWLRMKIPLPCHCAKVVAPTVLLAILHLIDTHGAEWLPERLDNLLRWLAAFHKMHGTSAETSSYSRLVH